MKCMSLLLSGIMSLPAAAQDPHAGHTTAPPAQPSSPPVTPIDSHADHDTLPPPSSPAAADPHEGHKTLSSGDSVGETATGAAQSVGDTPAPSIIRDNTADQYYGGGPMERAREVLIDEHGGGKVSKVMGNILEYAEADEGNGYRWDLEAWYGDDMHRFVVKTEGEEFHRDGADLAETQALYSRAVGRYTDVQAGVRYDLDPDRRAYATLGVETLFPYWFEMEATLFVSDRGDTFGRLEGIYDLRLTQRFILQPRIEVELAAQSVPEAAVGSGISSAELGLRLRYDIRREFAPYIGVNLEKSFGRTADFARAAGEDVEDASIVVGLRAWF